MKRYDLIGYLSRHGYLNWMSDKMYLECVYKNRFGKKLDLQNPRTYNEKIQWLKLYDRNPQYSLMVDKFEVKDYVASTIGKQYIIPTLGVWNHFEEIDFDELPTKFVLKCTHDSGGLFICKNKADMDYKTAKEKINKSLKSNYYLKGREWPYKYVKPRIIAEQYMEDTKTGELRDYKFFAFDGCVKALFIATERQEEGRETKFDFFDENFNHLPFTNGHPNAEVLPEKPTQFELMKSLASRLSNNIPHVRVDFYEVDGQVFFGELTFSHWGGMMPFVPGQWDEIFGSWITLPERNK